jgi:S-adenosylmethionine synthetase
LNFRVSRKHGLAGIYTGLQASCLLLSGAGNFEVGGPEGENSLSDKKLAVDTYGPQVPLAALL